MAKLTMTELANVITNLDFGSSWTCPILIMNLIFTPACTRTGFNACPPLKT